MWLVPLLQPLNCFRRCFVHWLRSTSYGQDPHWYLCASYSTTRHHKCVALRHQKRALVCSTKVRCFSVTNQSVVMSPFWWQTSLLHMRCFMSTHTYTWCQKCKDPLVLETSAMVGFARYGIDFCEDCKGFPKWNGFLRRMQIKLYIWTSGISNNGSGECVQRAKVGLIWRQWVVWQIQEMEM